MKKSFLILSVLFACGALFAAPSFLGYLYPSGGQQGTMVRVIAGGQGFGGRVTLLSNNPGIKLKSAVRIPYMGYFHPTQRKYLTQVMKNIYAGKMEKFPVPENKEGEVWRKHPWLDDLEMQPLLERSIVAESLFVRVNPLQQAPSIATRVLLDIEIAPDAPVGKYWIRLVSGMNISNEKLFFVDDAEQVLEPLYHPSFVKKPAVKAVTGYPVVFNGQIMPGETDVFPVMLDAGRTYSFAMCASELSPYLGDAVPGHFQGILTLRDAQGREVAAADDEYHHPDPVLRFTAKKSGKYTLHVSDSIKRGRADFVYRIAVTEGHVPYQPYRNIFGYKAMPQAYALKDVPRTIPSASLKKGVDIRGVLRNQQGVSFKVKAVKGQRAIFELFAARLDSPLDGVLVLLDAAGKVIAENDDFAQSLDLDLCRRQTDSLLDVTFPADGVYTLQLYSRTAFSDNDHFFTLQMRAPQPSVIAVSGSSVLALKRNGEGKLHIHIQRKDGFNGEVKITSPQLTAIGKAVIPAGKQSGDVRFYLTNAPKKNQPITLKLNAEYTVDGKKYIVPVIPAEETMQAFAYTHLLAAEKFYCYTIRPAAHLVKKKKAPAKKK